MGSSSRTDVRPDKGDVAVTAVKGDTVLIKAVMKGEGDTPEEIVVTLRSKTTEYDTAIARNRVTEVLGPDWWPPEQNDVYLSPEGKTYTIQKLLSGEMVAVTPREVSNNTKGTFELEMHRMSIRSLREIARDLEIVFRTSWGGRI